MSPLDKAGQMTLYYFATACESIANSKALKKKILQNLTNLIKIPVYSCYGTLIH